MKLIDKTAAVAEVEDAMQKAAGEGRTEMYLMLCLIKKWLEERPEVNAQPVEE